MFENFVELDVDMSKIYQDDEILETLRNLEGLTVEHHSKWAMIINSVLAMRKHVYNKYMRFDERVCHIDILTWAMDVALAMEDCGHKFQITIGTPMELIQLHASGEWSIIKHRHGGRPNHNRHIPLIFHVDDKNHCVVTYHSDGNMQLLYNPSTTH